MECDGNIFEILLAVRLEMGENIEENKKNLMILTQRVFDVIVASSER